MSKRSNAGARRYARNAKDQAKKQPAMRAAREDAALDALLVRALRPDLSLEARPGESRVSLQIRALAIKRDGLPAVEQPAWFLGLFAGLHAADALHGADLHALIERVRDGGLA